MSASKVEDEAKQASNGEDDDSSNQTLTERYFAAIALVETSPDQCLSLLEQIQKDVDALSLFSKNEMMEDVSTKSIPFLALEHFLASALVNLPAGPGAMSKRKSNILQSCALWAQFLERLETLEVLTKEETKEYHDLLEEQQQYANESATDEGTTRNRLPPAPSRDDKIARSKAIQQR